MTKYLSLRNSVTRMAITMLTLAPNLRHRNLSDQFVPALSIDRESLPHGHARNDSSRAIRISDSNINSGTQKGRNSQDSEQWQTYPSSQPPCVPARDNRLLYGAKHADGRKCEHQHKEKNCGRVADTRGGATPTKRRKREHPFFGDPVLLCPGKHNFNFRFSFSLLRPNIAPDRFSLSFFC